MRLGYGGATAFPDSTPIRRGDELMSRGERSVPEKNMEMRGGWFDIGREWVGPKAFTQWPVLFEGGGPKLFWIRL